MLRFFIGIARFSLAAWVGAAVLFVVVGIREVRAPELGSATRDILVALRFPSYYLFGFAFVGTALLSLASSAIISRVHQRRYVYLASGLILVLLIMLADYLWVYAPLLELITPPGKSRPASFVAYHNASKWLNFASVSLCAIIALILCGIEQPQDKPPNE